jgi:dTDP-4-amino-4,6-dideoxygalactose transaminase
MNPSLQVPFLDLAAVHGPMRGEFLQAINEVIDAGEFAGGPFVSRFEEDFAEYCGVPHAVGVGSGTDALWLSLMALGVGPGDEVITVPMTFIATVEAISRTGARPVFVDIDPTTYTMDPADLASAVTPRTKVILPVHLFGRMAEMETILTFAKERGLYVVEDASQAHGAESHGRRAGSLGDAGCFSFYPGKNLGAFGEAGAVVTKDPELARRMRILRDHGQSRRYLHSVIGWNCRMDGIQAAVLHLKLERLDENNELRRQHAARYARALERLPGLALPAPGGGRSHVHHLYAIRVPDRRRFMEHLRERGIGTAIHYPLPVHLQTAYSHLGLGRGSFPVSEHCAEQFVSLPMYPELTAKQIDLVVQAVCEATGAAMAV